MKILIASDIHGSVYYCGKLLEAYKNEGAEMLLSWRSTDETVAIIENGKIVRSEEGDDVGATQ